MLKFYEASLVLEKQGLQEVTFIKQLLSARLLLKGRQKFKRSSPLRVSWHKGLKPSYTNF